MIISGIVNTMTILENPDGCGWENAKEFSGEWATIKAEANVRVEKIILSFILIWP